jgi:hypothetical protein
MSIPGISGDIPAGGGGVGELPDMSIPGMSAGMLAVGAGEAPDMSIPGMSAAMLAVGAGEAPDMSIPGMSAAMVGDGVLPDMSFPGMADDVGLDVSIINPKTALATARSMVEITMRRVRVMLAIESSSQIRCVVLDAGGRLVVALYDGHDRRLLGRRSRDHRFAPGAQNKPAGQGCLIIVGFASRDSPGDSMKVP